MNNRWSPTLQGDSLPSPHLHYLSLSLPTTALITAVSLALACWELVTEHWRLNIPAPRVQPGAVIRVEGKAARAITGRERKRRRRYTVSLTDERFVVMMPQFFGDRGGFSAHKTGALFCVSCGCEVLCEQDLCSLGMSENLWVCRGWMETCTVTLSHHVSVMVLRLHSNTPNRACPQG